MSLLFKVSIKVSQLQGTVSSLFRDKRKICDQYESKQRDNKMLLSVLFTPFLTSAA